MSKHSTSVYQCMSLHKPAFYDCILSIRFHHCRQDSRAIVIPRCIVIIQIIIKVRRMV